MDQPAGGPEPDRLTPPTPEQVDKAEGLLRQARLMRARGDKAAADRLLEEAKSAAPNCAVVLEAIGDDLMERRQYQKAMEAYKDGVAADPKSVILERKYAESVLLLSGAGDPLVALSDTPDVGQFANAKAAMILNVLLPGLGQFILGQTAKGIGFFVAWAIPVIICVANPSAMATVSNLFGRSNAGQFQPWILIPLFAAFAAWFAAMADATVASKRVTPRQIVRPLPPVDKDFEL